MIELRRISENPILSPAGGGWEEKAVFNGCAIEQNGEIHLVYRAVSAPQSYFRGINTQISSIGHAVSPDGVHFQDRTQFIKPQYEWEIFGCEDPRVTKIGGEYFIFYTALSTYPFSPPGIRVGVAISRDLKTVDEKHLVTPFNAKAMALFPQTINGKIAGILTINTDLPPAEIALVLFDKKEDIWSEVFWKEWFSAHELHVIPLLRSFRDQVEVGAPPIKTKDGWLLIYAYIKNYYSPTRIFGIEAVLLDLNDPTKILTRTEDPLLLPDRDYELYGNVPNVIFPTGAIIKNDEVLVYYGASDTTCCVATCSLDKLLLQLRPKIHNHVSREDNGGKLVRFLENPIISPIPEFVWEAKATFNPATIYADGKVHVLYRAMSQDNTSVIGYASSPDGFHINERLTHPIYLPRESFETKTKSKGNSGCEDPRITRIKDILYMCYTAFDGRNPPRVALTSIRIEDFLNKRWNWEKPKLISPPGIHDKDACILPKKINGKYVVFHRMDNDIWVDFLDDLEFSQGKYLKGKVLLEPRADKWDSVKIGIGPPPIETKNGWLLIYHGITGPSMVYKAGIALLALDDPSKVLGRTDDPILEPEMTYEKEGEVDNVVFPCGTVVINGRLFVYYGGGDRVTAVVTCNLDKLLEEFS